LKLPEERQRKTGWQHAAGVAMEAVKGGNINQVPLAFKMARVLRL
jgi:hypothetical protein